MGISELVAPETRPREPARLGRGSPATRMKFEVRSGRRSLAVPPQFDGGTNPEPRRYRVGFAAHDSARHRHRSQSHGDAGAHRFSNHKAEDGRDGGNHHVRWNQKLVRGGPAESVLKDDTWASALPPPRYARPRQTRVHRR